MINKILILASFIVLIATTNSQAQNKAASYDNFTVMVEGLGCPFCAYGLEKKFKELKGLKKPAIDMETGKFTFQYPTEKKLSIEQVEQQVDAAGYTAVKVTIDRANGSQEVSGETVAVVGQQVEQKQLSVAGNCGMCQARIEKAASRVNGVSKASWEEDKQLLTVSFDQEQTSLKAIAKAIAKAGHDNNLAKASSSTYEQLPACCLYRP